MNYYKIIIVLIANIFIKFILISVLVHKKYAIFFSIYKILKFIYLHKNFIVRLFNHYF
jgi:hypothetical protein